MINYVSMVLAYGFSRRVAFHTEALPKTTSFGGLLAPATMSTPVDRSSKSLEARRKASRKTGPQFDNTPAVEGSSSLRLVTGASP